MISRGVHTIIPEETYSFVIFQGGGGGGRGELRLWIYACLCQSITFALSTPKNTPDPHDLRMSLLANYILTFKVKLRKPYSVHHSKSYDTTVVNILTSSVWIRMSPSIVDLATANRMQSVAF